MSMFDILLTLLLSFWQLTQLTSLCLVLRQHVVYEHPRDAETDTILDQFQCRSSKAGGTDAAAGMSGMVTLFC